MNLLIVNGSPRGRKSNSDKMLKWIFADEATKSVSTTGGLSTISCSVEKIYVVDIKEREHQMKLMEGADSILVIFPLYTDGMPGITKEIFERMENVKGSLKGKAISFIVHSGFPEPKQSRAVEKYTAHLASLLGMNYLGTVVMSGSESLTAAPDSMFKKKFASFRQIGRCIAEGKPFEEATLVAIAGPEVLSAFKLFVMKYINVSTFFWNHLLKKNHAFEKRFDSPYK
jgi:multimeric flavodoxin WrbA